MHFQKTNTLKVLKLSVTTVSKVKNFSVLKVRAIMKLIERGDYLNRLIRLKETFITQSNKRFVSQNSIS